ncbi:MAG: MFS transporter [Hylemonella sp.]|nr:MFS transporter [Hylemonella sp.]MDP1938353.1 MFS transporter [Hylemonella sp.]
MHPNFLAWLQPSSTSAADSAAYRKVALAACFGTFIEWYDFLTFATLAVHFAVLFFPADDPVAGLLYSLATFGMGMVVRPLGAALFGSFGDRYGRRKVFIATIGIMGVATFLVGLLPTHAQWGWAATGMLLALRLVQGLAMGGEIGGANVYLAEHAPAERRGALTSVLQWMGGLGILASTLQIVLLQTWLSEADFKDWGWRIPFLLSALLLLASMKARLALHESPVFTELSRQNNTAKTPLLDCLRDRQTLGRMALLFFSISAGGGLLFFCSQVYASIYLKTVVKMDPVQVGWITLAATLCLFPLTYVCGALSDRLGRRPVVLAGLLLGAASILPVYAGLQQLAQQPVLVFVLLLIPVLAVALVTGPQTALLSELFPARTRYTAVGLPHNLAAGWIGGLSPYMVTLIAEKSGSALMGLGYPTALLLVALVVGYFFLPETRGADLNT